jgi:branched-chain amino acid transport system substrate-binding protein
MSIGEFDLGMGQALSFGGITGRRQASDHVYYTGVRGGRFVQFRDSEWEAWAKR